MEAPTPDEIERTKPSKMRITQGKKIRVVAKIRGSSSSSKPEAEEFVPCVSVGKPKGDDDSIITLTTNHEQPASSYEVNYCYEQDQGNAVVFQREIEPLISGLLHGYNATVIASGAKDSGKTYLIQGTNEEPGLASLTLACMLHMVEGTENFIEISSYEVTSDHVYDLLGPSRHEVFVRGDTQGNIQLSGLSQVLVTSMPEFHKLFDSERGKCKPMQRTMVEFSRRCHRGLTIHVLSKCKKLVGKMNFVDLAGYEDPRRKSIDGPFFLETTKINKSINALHNVLYSLSKNDMHIPYRETKLTHMLQDSLGGDSRILMITCLSSSFCQDSICMVSLASRYCQGTIKGVPSSMKKPNILARSSLFNSCKSKMPKSVSTTTKKSVGRIHFEKKANNPSTLKARKLFGEAKSLTIEQISIEASSLDVNSTIECALQNQDSCPSAYTKPEEMITLDKDTFLLGKREKHVEVTPIKENLFLVEEGEDVEKENNNSLNNEGGSPPISAQLQELSNNLKLLYNSTPSCVEKASKSDAVCQTQTSSNFVEPITPNESVRCGKLDVTYFQSPWQTFNSCSSRAKDSLVQECLNFLNKASKEELQRLKGIGEKRAAYILELREESPEPFKHLDDLQNIGLSAKQIKGVMRKNIGELF